MRPGSWWPWLVVLATAYALLAVVVAIVPILGAPAALVVLAAEVGWRRAVPEATEALRAMDAEDAVRCLVRGSLVAVVAIRAAELPTLLVAWLLAVVALLAVAPVAGQLLGRRAALRIRDQVRWQNLELAGGSTGPATVPLPGSAAPVYARGGGGVALEWPLVIAVGVGALMHRTVIAWSVLGAALAVITAVVLLRCARAVTFDRAARSTPDATVMPGLLSALTDLAPTVVVYFSSPATGSYALRVWLDTLRRIDEPVLVLLREAEHLAALDFSGLPVVVLPAAKDVEAARVPSMRLVLYPTNVVKNNHMIRLPGLRHVFIGHGDSDKAGSASPVSRVYDEIWVAGEAGRDRYLVAAEGVRAEQIRLVSRPQLAGLAGPAPVRDGCLPTILYAPTWEGFYEDSDYCSVATPGLDAVRAMVASGRVRVLFKPHPATGQRRADATAAVAEIERLVAAAPHARVADAPEALYDAMRTADVLLTDVSSVLSDWLACRRPYLVTNPQRLAWGELHQQFPTTRGGQILDPGGDVLALIDDAVGADRLAQRRAELATYLIGRPRPDPLQDFLDEVSMAILRAAPTTATYRTEPEPAR